MERILIAGCGYVGTELVARLAADGCQVFGLRRSDSPLPPGVHAVRADLTRLESLGALPPRLDAVVYAAGPAQATPEAYRAAYLDGLGTLLRGLHELAEAPRRLLFCSSTAVYGQRRGEWVDEDSPARPDRFAGDILLSAEALARAAGLEAACVRFSGIYGPGRIGLLERLQRGEVQLGDMPFFQNRIHRHDAAGVLRHLLQIDSLESLYLASDCEPTDEAELTQWLAKAVGALPPRAASAVGGAAPIRRTGSKRCRNQRLTASGYRFRYPTFREGYAPLARQLRGR